MPRARVVMMFADGETPSIAHGGITSPASAYAELNSWLSGHAATDVRPLFEGTSASAATAGERRQGLDRFFVADVELAEREISGRLEEVNALPYVEDAYVEARPEPAAGRDPI